MGVFVRTSSDRPALGCSRETQFVPLASAWDEEVKGNERGGENETEDGSCLRYVGRKGTKDVGTSSPVFPSGPYLPTFLDPCVPLGVVWAPVIRGGRHLRGSAVVRCPARDPGLKLLQLALFSTLLSSFH